MKKTARYLNDNRAYLLVIIMLIVGLFARKFYTMLNMTGIMNATPLYAIMGIGFTLCMIAGHFDFSVGLVANLGGVLAIGLRVWSHLPWVTAILVATLAGGIVGVINGLLVSKGKIHSFIATLGMQFVTKGIVYIYCKANSVSDNGDFVMADFFNKVLKPLPLTPKVLIALVLVIIFAVVMAKTRFGRNIYMLGGNPETAWLAGIKRDFYIIAVFTLSGLCCALAGAIFSIAQSSAVPNLGEKGISPLMVALTATIIGGTSVTGGKGSIWKSYVSVLGLMTMFNVLTSLVGKYEVQILANGIVIVLCVTYETIAAYNEKKTMGIRSKLLQEHKDMLQKAEYAKS